MKLAFDLILHTLFHRVSPSCLIARGGISVTRPDGIALYGRGFPPSDDLSWVHSPTDSIGLHDMVDQCWALRAIAGYQVVSAAGGFHGFHGPDGDYIRIVPRRRDGGITVGPGRRRKISDVPPVLQ